MFELQDLRRDWYRWCAAERIAAMLIALAVFGAPAALYIATAAQY